MLNNLKAGVWVKLVSFPSAFDLAGEHVALLLRLELNQKKERQYGHS